MKKLLVLLAIAGSIAACSKTETPATTAPATTPAAAIVAAPIAPTTAAADMPKECQDYLDKVSTCVGKQSGPGGDAIKAAMEQTKAAWATMAGDKSSLASACKMSSDAFAQQATAMKC